MTEANKVEEVKIPVRNWFHK